MGIEAIPWVIVNITRIVCVQCSVQNLVHGKHSINLTIDVIHSLGRSYPIENLYAKSCTQMFTAAFIIHNHPKVEKPKALQLSGQTQVAHPEGL